MRYVTARRFCIAESIRHKRRSYSASGVWPCAIKRMYDYLDASINACWLDFYGVLHKHHLILGNDHLMNLVVAYALGAKGESVLIVDDYQAQDNVLSQRYQMKFPGMGELIGEALGLRIDPSEALEKQVANAIHDLVSADGEPLVHQLESATLMHEQSSDQHLFWAESTSNQIHPLGVPSLRFWNSHALELHGGEVGKCHQFRAVFDRIILTSSCQYSRLNGIHIPTVALGDAKTPLADFDFYRGSDRLRELLEAIKVIIHGQDVPATDKHDT